MADYYLGRTVIHGARRGEEMVEVADTLRSLDIEPLMAESAAKRIHWLANQDLKLRFENKLPKTYRQVLDALDPKKPHKAD